MKKTNLDEMQEQTLLRIEHNTCWLAFWLLSIVIVVQILIGGFLDHILGEVLCLGLISLYILFACLKNGIWDRNLKPSAGTNLMCSLIAGSVVGILEFIQLTRLDNPNALPTSLILGLSVFVLSIAVWSLCSFLYKKRAEKLERE